VLKWHGFAALYVAILKLRKCKKKKNSVARSLTAEESRLELPSSR